MSKYVKLGIVFVSITAILAGCGQTAFDDTAVSDTLAEEAIISVDEEPEENLQIVNLDVDKLLTEATDIALADDGIIVDGETVSTDNTAAVYAANDIVYYEEGKDFTYGEGTEADEHTKEEADEHTVVHITQPGTYAVSGTLSAGQIAIDLGEDAKENSEAVVNLILNGVDINCSVAPAVIFYNVYECGTTEEEEATNTVDTSAAGANVIIADGTENNIEGSYVARIYKSVELNEEGTEVVDSKKLHKYDAAFYSKMSMNLFGGKEGTGVLNIIAENEGLDSELHLTINGGNITITSGNDGINTNEDGISVTTINGGVLNITVDGSTGEGDGIDSNGWLVINGGTVSAFACAFSGDAGIDSDMGIHINGGIVCATGNMLDHISESMQNYAVFSFASRQSGGSTYMLKNVNNEVVAEVTSQNDFTYLIFSSVRMTEGTYTLWAGDTQLADSSNGAMRGGHGMGGDISGAFGGEMFEEMPEGMKRPEGMEMPPEGMKRPEGMEPPEGMKRPEEMEHPRE